MAEKKSTIEMLSELENYFTFHKSFYAMSLIAVLL